MLDRLDHTYLHIKSTIQVHQLLTFDEILPIQLQEEDLMVQNQPPETLITFFAGCGEAKDNRPRSAKGGHGHFKGCGHGKQPFDDKCHDKYFSDDCRSYDDGHPPTLRTVATTIIIVPMMIANPMTIDVPLMTDV